MSANHKVVFVAVGFLLASVALTVTPIIPKWVSLSPLYRIKYDNPGSVGKDLLMRETLNQNQRISTEHGPLTNYASDLGNCFIGAGRGGTSAVCFGQCVGAAEQTGEFAHSRARRACLCYRS